MGSWLQRTHQRWKLRVFSTGVIALGILLVVGLQSHSPLWLTLGSTALMGIWFLWFFASLRCSHCGARVGWWAVRTQAVNTWLPVLMALEKCPRCEQ
jgi:hypothetical protein